MASLTTPQQVFILSYLANGASGQHGSVQSLETILTDHINKRFTELASYLGDWSIAWGPVVTQAPHSTLATNAMYVAKGTDPNGNPLYVVGVAATNASSIFDWLKEDIDIRPLQAWTYGPSSVSNAQITHGTQTGLNYLLGMTDPHTQQSLETFLTNLQDDKTTLIFTGHSLGGALSPALALALFGKTFSVNDWAGVYVYPTAGATPGNQGFATSFQQVFPTLGPWNQVVWNTFDVVPHAWAESRLAELYTLYSPPIPRSLVIDAAIATAQANALGLGLTPLQNKALPGFFFPAPDPSELSAIDYFGKEALYQHVYAYFILLDIPEPVMAALNVTNPFLAAETAPASAPDTAARNV